MKFQTPEGYEFETGPYDGREDRCEYIHRLDTHSSIMHGGSSLGRCTNDALPGMRFCYVHADREAMAYHIRNMWDELGEIE
jgi:hypothetical protein